MKISRKPKLLALVLSILVACLGMAIIMGVQDESPPNVSDIELPELSFSEDSFQSRIKRGELNLDVRITQRLEESVRIAHREAEKHGSVEWKDIFERWNREKVDVELAKIPLGFWENFDSVMKAPKESTWDYTGYLSRLNLSATMRFKAWQLAQDGDADAGLRMGERMIILGYAHLEIAAGDRNLGYGLTMMELGYRAIWEVASNFPVSVECLRDVRLTIQNTHFTYGMLKTILRRGFCLGIKQIRISHEQGGLESRYIIKYVPDNGSFMTVPGLNQSLPSPFLYKPNETIRLFAECIREMILWGAPGVDARGLFQLIDDFEKRKIDSLVKGRFPYDPDNALGRLVVTASVQEYSFVFKRRLVCLSNASAIEAALAVREYELKKGKLPDSLDELVPEYFPTVPVDYMDNKPIRYSKEARAVWSIGKDLNLGLPLPKANIDDDRYWSIYRIPNGK